MRSEAQCVIVGGGVMGVGLAYHLAREGWTDTVLVEKDELTSGATWHAAGLTPHFIGSLNMAKVHAYGVDLYKRLEAETGYATGFHQCGALRLATNQDEVDWFHYVKGILDMVGVECHLVSPSEIPAINPLITVDDVKLGFHTPQDGWTDPSMATQAMAAGAKARGVEFVLHNRVLATTRLPDGRWRVETEQGPIVTEHLVNAAGHYGRQLGAMVGLDVPIVSMDHQYLVTDTIGEVAGLGFEPPVTRDPRASCYYRREHDGLIIGPYETRGARTYGTEGIDWDLTFHLTPPDIERLMPWIELAARRIPSFADAGIKRVVSGPITHTPDGGYLLGPAPGLRNYWMCVGASIGITQGPGAGKYLAQWMVHGQTEVNVREMDPRRFGPYATLEYTAAKSVDEYHEMYQVRLPGEYREAGRPSKVTPLFETLNAKGARRQEVYGWERAQYFSHEPERHSFRRSNAFEVVGEEVRAVRERMGVADLTAFAKIEVRGPDAASFLDRLSANRLPRRDGGIRLVHMLTPLGGIECEFTVTRLAEDRFYLNSAVVGQHHDLDWLNLWRRAGEAVEIVDVTDHTGILGVTGPRARDALAGLTSTPLDNDHFPWLTARPTEVAGVACVALRVSYVGELGWELHCPLDRLPDLYAAVEDRDMGMVDFGSYAMNAMRMEKAYKAWGGELTTEITPVEAGIERFVDYDKEFIGREAVMERKNRPPSMVCVYGELSATDSDCRGNEPVFHEGEMVGITTGGAYGHTVGKSLFFAYVDPRYSSPGSRLAIRVLGDDRPALLPAEAAWDPSNLRPRS